MRSAGLLSYTRFRVGIEALVVALVLSFIWSPLIAHELVPPTRISPYDWACLASNGAVLSNHQRFDTALYACLDNEQGAEIVGGRYRLNRTPEEPDPDPPTCPAKPADEMQPGACPSGTSGSWTQTRTYASAAAPTCWTAGEWLPAEPPTGACTPICPEKPADETRPGTCPSGTSGSWTQSRTYASAAAPTCWTAGEWLPAEPPTGTCTATPLPAVGGISATSAVNQDRYDVRLSWLVVAGATRYEIERCTGATCTNFTGLAGIPPQPPITGTNYTNNYVPGALTYRYRIRAMNATQTGAWSAIRNVTTPTPPPPPPGAGAAVLNWTPPTQDTNGDTLTNLIGYRVLYGTSPGALTQVVTLANAGLTTHTVESLASGTWYFALRAIAGDPACLPVGADCVVQESVNSNTVSKVVQ